MGKALLGGTRTSRRGMGPAIRFRYSIQKRNDVTSWLEEAEGENCLRLPWFGGKDLGSGEGTGGEAREREKKKQTTARIRGALLAQTDEQLLPTGLKNRRQRREVDGKRGNGAVAGVPTCTKRGEL